MRAQAGEKSPAPALAVAEVVALPVETNPEPAITLTPKQPSVSAGRRRFWSALSSPHLQCAAAAAAVIVLLAAIAIGVTSSAAHDGAWMSCASDGSICSLAPI